jgi:hypothetical protein
MIDFSNRKRAERIGWTWKRPDNRQNCFVIHAPIGRAGLLLGITRHAHTQRFGDVTSYFLRQSASSSMPYKWMLLGGVLMAAAPTYLLFQGDRIEAAIVGIPLSLIAMALFFCIWVLRAG